MIAEKKHNYISPEDYLAGERVSPLKHEYRRGFVRAMVGARKPHVVLAGNLVTLLNLYLRESPCLVLSSDIKIRLLEANCYYYPDVTVTCDPRDIETTEDFICHPSLIIEVLSDSTKAFDRGKKFADYQTLPSLKEYVLVHQSHVEIECFRLSALNQWQSQTYTIGDEVCLESVDWRSPISSIYQKVLM